MVSLRSLPCVMGRGRLQLAMLVISLVFNAVLLVCLLQGTPDYSQSFDSWHENLYQQRRKVNLKPRFRLEDHRQATTTFDIVINAFKRDYELTYALKHYRRCRKLLARNSLHLAHVHVVWNDFERPVPAEFHKWLRENVSFFKPPSNKICNRFWPLNFTSDAVFHVDDDTYFSCPALEDMFQIWRSDLDGMVGASTRKMVLGEIDCWECSIITGEYNMIFVTKGAFVHKRFFDEFWKDIWKPMREIANKYNCAEDILFGFMHLATTGSVNHMYAVAGTVNMPESSKDGYIVKDFQMHVANTVGQQPTFDGLNIRTWNVRTQAVEKLNIEIRKAFPELVKKRVFDLYNNKWWRSLVNFGLTCRGQAVGCYNRAWSVCQDACDVRTRGQTACFTGDGACWAGNMFHTPVEQDQHTTMICHHQTDTWCQGGARR